MKEGRNIFIVAFFVSILIMLEMVKKDDKKNGSGQTRGIRNNNPFNIKYNAANKWQGQTGSDGIFCKFDTMQNGVRAFKKILETYARKYGIIGCGAVLDRFAPPVENDLLAYKSYVFGRGIKPTAQAVGNYEFAAAVAFFESRYELTKELYEKS